MMALKIWNSFLLLAVNLVGAQALLFAPDTSGDVIITEVSDSGAFDACGGDGDVAGNDYVEFLNTGFNPADLSGFILHDNISGPDDAAAFTFPEGTVLEPAAYLLVCGGETFTFDIEGSDTVTLLDSSAQILSSVGPLTLGGAPGVSYQRKRDGTFAHNDASPGTKNIIPGIGFGTVIVTEISNTGVFSTCGGDAQNAGADYVELFNTGDLEFDLSGFILHDDKVPDDPNATPLADGTLIAARSYLLLCSGVRFPFGIGGDGAIITLLDPTGDFVSESWPLSRQGTSTLSYQRVDDLTSTPTWVYAFPSPGMMNNPDMLGIVRISEVAPMGSPGACNGEAWVELFNDGFGVVNIAGFVLSDTSGAGAYTFPEFFLAARAFAVVCAVETFQFAIEEGGRVTLSDDIGNFVSDTGVIGNGATAPSAMAVWALKIDGSQSATPFAPFFTYSKDATPRRLNAFPFEKVDVPLQSCGIASKSYPAPVELVYQETLTFGRNPEFSGGSFYGGTCSHFVFSDQGTVHEFVVDANGLKEVRSILLVGGSGDTEGSCFYTDDSGTSLVYVDEHERSVAICDLPTVEQGSDIYRESSNCKVIGLTDTQKSDPTQTSTDSNEGFEGVACDPVNQKLYVVQEKNPMRIWSVDIAAETFTTLIDVENLESWTSLVTDLAGISYDPIDETLYLVSQESKLVVETTLAGDIVGAPLDVSMASQPEGIHFIPESGEMWISSEPNEILIFMAVEKEATASPTPAPAPFTSAPTDGVVTNPPTTPTPTEAPSTSAPTNGVVTHPPTTPTPTGAPSTSAPTDGVIMNPPTTPTPTVAPSPSAPTDGVVTNPPTTSPTVDPISTASVRANSLFVSAFLAALLFFSSC